MTTNVNHLHSKEARKEWEQLFSTSYIEPILSNLEPFVAGALDLVVDDDQQGVILLSYHMHYAILHSILNSRARQIVLPGLRKGQG